MTIETGNGFRLGADFANAVCNEVFDSSAVSHPYLDALRDGDLPNIRMAFQDFAFQYGLYSANFVAYMSAVIANLRDSEHKAILMANLAEEKGDCHDADLPPDIAASIEGQPHALLYRRFQVALGVDQESELATPDCPGQIWSQRFLTLCESNELAGVGAIGIGTELIVARIYNQILEGLKSFGRLSAADRVFFDLHSVCDDEHAAQMLLITQDLAEDEYSRAEIKNGVLSALELRSTFWDEMLVRAQAFPASEPVRTSRASSVGHQESL